MPTDLPLLYEVEQTFVHEFNARAYHLCAIFLLALILRYLHSYDYHPQQSHYWQEQLELIVSPLLL